MKYFILVVALLISFSSQAQISVSGQISDENNAPIAFSNFTIKEIDSGTIVTGGISDENGKYALQSPIGKYRIEVSFIGYEPYSKVIELTESLILENIVLIGIVDQLDEVVIRGKKPVIQQSADRLTFNVENSVMATGGNIVDILKVTPSINITDQGISIIGKGDVSVLINGNPVKLRGEALVTFLNSIQAENIAKIEVIDSPPSNFDAEGSNGLINIIYKKGLAGLWNTTINGSYRQGVYSLYSLGASTIYNDDKLSFSANLNYVDGSKQVEEMAIIFYDENIWDNDITRENISKNLNGNLSLDYQYSPKSNIGFQYLGTVEHPDVDYNGLTQITDYNNTLDSLIVSKNFTENKNYNHSFNIYHETDLDTLGKKMTIGADYFILNNKNYSSIESRNFIDESTSTGVVILADNDSKQKIENVATKLDFQIPTKLLDLSFGGKLSFTTTTNNTTYLNAPEGTATTVPDQDNNFEYKEDIQAVYITGKKAFNKKWESTFGLRMENTNTNGISMASDGSFEEENSNSYLKLFPTMTTSYRANESNVLSFSYSKRITRPAFWELNPYRNYFNAYIYSEGNPFLQPSFSHNIEFTHSLKNKFTSSFFVSIVDNGFGQIPGVNTTTGEQFYTRSNYYRRTSYGISESYNVDVFKWWKSYNYLFAFYNDVSFLPGTDLETEALDGFGLRYSSMNTFTLNASKTFNGEINFWYFPGTKYQVYESTGSSGLDLGIKWSVKDNLQLTATVKDIFNQNNPTYTTSTSSTPQEFSMNGSTRYLRISARYQFGNKKINKSKRDFGNESEKSRAIN